MKTCLICNHQEPARRTAGKPGQPDPPEGRRASPDVEYICSTCLQELTKTTQEEINKKYIAAVKKSLDDTAYALHTFASRSVREKYPLKRR